MKLFNRENRIRHNLELVSIHIPKTAGTSFRNFLKAVYGEKNAVRLDINITTKRIDLENEAFTAKKLPSNIRVIHGHFYYADLIEQIAIKPDLPVITWVRDPSERVVSNYLYLEKRLKEELEEEKKGLNILSKMQKNVIEYARNEISRNRISKFLDGIDPEDMFFIGIYEHFEEDMRDLAEMLGIRDYPIFQHNITGTGQKFDPAIMEEIRKLNALDHEIYERALELRKRRKKKPGRS